MTATLETRSPAPVARPAAGGRRHRILFLLHSLQGGGAERVMVQLMNRLDRTRYQPMLAVGAMEGPYVEELSADVPVHRLGARQARFVVPALVRAVWTLRPEIIISTAGFNFAVVAARPLLPLGTRIILREVNTPTAFLEDIGRRSRLRKAVYRGVYGSLYGLADHVVCQSEAMRQDVQALTGLPDSKLAAIPNPVDVERIAELAAQQAPDYTGPGPHLVAVGRCARQKGYDVLLAAFTRVRHEHPGADLTVLGDGEERPRLEALAAQLGIDDAVRFLGFRQNPYPYLKGADVCVSSSRYEGSANAVLEAMACGTTVVATDCPGNSRELIEDGVTGYLAPPQDEQALAEAICRALAARPGLDARRIQAACEARCGIQHVVPRYEALLARVMEGCRT